MGEQRQVRLIQVVVSVVAFAAFLGHLFVPDLDLDLVAVVLLGLAVLPWLGALVESVEVGGAKLRYRELRQQVEQVADHLEQARASLGTLDSRVGAIETFMFSGMTTPEQEGVLSRALSAYREFLARLGVEPGPTLRIHVDADEKPFVAYPDAAHGRFVIGAALADSPDALLHEYTHHLCEQITGTGRERWEPGIRAVESGLAYYLPASAVEKPVSAGRYDLSAPPDPHAAAPDVAHRDGLRWAAALWELRTRYGPVALDGALVEAWRRTWSGAEHDVARFLRELKEAAALPGDAIDGALRRLDVPMH